VDVAVNVATSGLLRDAVEFIHAAVHVAGGRDIGEYGDLCSDLYVFLSLSSGFHTCFYRLATFEWFYIRFY